MFIAGVVLGFFIGEKVAYQKSNQRFSQMRSGNYKQFSRALCNRFIHQLKLNNQQQELIKPIVDEFLSKKKKLASTSAPLQHELMDNLKKNIKNILTPEQIINFEKSSFSSHDKSRAIQRRRNMKKERMKCNNRGQK